MLVGSMVSCLLAGLLIDRKAGTSPTWTLVCSLVGIAVGIYLVVREGNRL
jgi:F0F1-type ATP synthase assembly protein I